MFLQLKFLILIIGPHLELFENWHATNYLKAHHPISKEKEHMKKFKSFSSTSKENVLEEKNFYLVLFYLHFIESDKFDKQTHFWVWKIPGVENVNLLQYSYLKNSRYREVWQATVPVVTKSCD